MKTVKDLIKTLAANEELGVDSLVEAIVSVRSNGDELTESTLSAQLEEMGHDYTPVVQECAMEDVVLDAIDHIFLDRYIVANFFLPKHIGCAEEDAFVFKEFLKERACSGITNIEMEALLADFKER